MVVFEIDVNGYKQNLYMDNELRNRILTKVKPKVELKDSDWCWIVDGPEGSGKSTFGMQLAKVLDHSFCLDRVVMTPEEFTKVIMRAKKGQAIVFDEGFTGLSSRSSLSEVNKIIVSLMMEMRQKNLFVIIIMPTIFLLDRYVAIFRAKGLFHIYTKNGIRGRWVYFNNKNKKLLYIMGKKLFSYGKPRSKFRGRFRNQYVVDEQAYRDKKRQALHKKARSTRAETYKYQRDLLFYIMNKVLDINQITIAEHCKKLGFKIERNTISDAVTEKNLQIIAKLEET